MKTLSTATFKVWTVIVITLVTTSYVRNQSNTGNSSLKNRFGKDFLIGTALNTSQIQEKDLHAAHLVPEQFNSISPENVMKCEVIHPDWNTYYFDLADPVRAIRITT